MSPASERTIAATTHGRYLVAPAVGPGPAPLLVGFHGYAELAEAQLARLQTIPGQERWLLVSVQGLHAFYRGRSQEVAASWMTRQQRDLAIQDNTAYCLSVVEVVASEAAIAPPLVFAGFSQGVAMAFRAAAASARAVSAVIAVGGDIPPEIDANALARVRRVLIGRGLRDEWYTPAIAAADLQRLEAAHVDVNAVTFDGGHEWTPELSVAIARFLETLNPR